MSLVGTVIPPEVAPDAISLHLGVRVTYRNQGATPILLRIENDRHIVLSGGGAWTDETTHWTHLGKYRTYE
ncbi:MAG TPA: hypothetical protein VGG72_13495 [Bryobacteraceae bacterium]|jgi:hypothetical protein